MAVSPDEGAVYDGGVFEIDLGIIVPMVADPGNPDMGIPSDPTNGANVFDIGDVKIDIAYGGSCTAGKADDVAYYADVCAAADAAGLSVDNNVKFFICSQDHVYSFNFSDFYWLKLGKASNDYNKTLRIHTLGLSDKLLTFLIRILSNRAGINHIDIGILVKGYFSNTGVLK